MSPLVVCIVMLVMRSPYRLGDAGRSRTGRACSEGGAAADEHVLEELTGAPSRAPVDVPLEPLLELEARSLEDLRVERMARR